MLTLPPAASNAAALVCKDFAPGNRVGMVVPIRMSKPVIAKMHSGVARQMKPPGAIEMWLTQDLDATVNMPDEFGTRIRIEIA